MLPSTPSDLNRSIPESERHSTASAAEMLAQHADPVVPSVTKARLHLPYIDGIRAVMALYVVHNHLLAAIGYTHMAFSVRPTELRQLLHQGHLAVVVFIVLSGYCLMLPVLRDNATLRGGIATFFKRRAKRILPPYYAALLVSALLVFIVHRIWHRPISEITSLGGWMLHLSLLHNLSWDHIYDYNGALWSIATEWQIYFLFPFLFLPVWKRFGEGALLLAGCVLAAAVTLLFPLIARGCPWFIALFALGMIAAKLSLQPLPWTKRIPWAWVGTSLALAMYIVMRVAKGFEWSSALAIEQPLGWYQLTDIVFGAATFCFLLHGTRATLEKRSSKFVTVLTCRPLVFVGAFSYSLYLIHMPLQTVALRMFSPLHSSRGVMYVLMMLICVPATIAFAYGFYQLFEKPFLGSAKRKNYDIKHSSV